LRSFAKAHKAPKEIELLPEEVGNLYKFYPRVEYIETLLLHDELFFRSPTNYSHEINLVESSSTNVARLEDQAVCCFSWIDSVIYDVRMWNLRADGGRGACVIFHDIPVQPTSGSQFEMLHHKMSKDVKVSLAGYASEDEINNLRAKLPSLNTPELPTSGNIASPLEPKKYEYENEYRLFYTGCTCPDGEYLKFDSSMYFKVKGIVFGYHMALGDKRRIRNASQESGNLGLRFFELSADLKAKIIAVGEIDL
jgi:hypothetical protein